MVDAGAVRALPHGGRLTPRPTGRDMEKIIQSTGFFPRPRPPPIIGGGPGPLCDRFGGEVPNRLRDLVHPARRGAARNRPTWCSGNAFGIPGESPWTPLSAGWPAASAGPTPDRPRQGRNPRWAALFPPLGRWTMLSAPAHLARPPRVPRPAAPACGAWRGVARLVPVLRPRPRPTRRCARATGEGRDRSLDLPPPPAGAGPRTGCARWAGSAQRDDGRHPAAPSRPASGTGRPSAVLMLFGRETEGEPDLPQMGAALVNISSGCRARGARRPSARITTPPRPAWRGTDHEGTPRRLVKEGITVNKRGAVVDRNRHDARPAPISPATNSARQRMGPAGGKWRRAVAMSARQRLHDRATIILNGGMAFI